MPLRAGTRPLKRWRYAGVFTDELMLCAGEAWVGPLPLRWWAVATPDGALLEHTTNRRGGIDLREGRLRVQAAGVRVELELGAGGEPVETASPVGDAYAWTRKRAGAEARGTVELAGRRYAIDGPCAVIDDSAGYHPRHTAWQWSAGVGVAEGGGQVAWNLVAGIHEAVAASERTVWVDGQPHEVGPVAFAPDLSAVGGLRFSEWSAREDDTNLLVLRSRYRQPFGTFAGRLPGGIVLSEGYGVMESHDARW